MDIQAIMSSDYSKSCRLCLSVDISNGNKSLTDQYDNKESYFHIFYECFGHYLKDSNVCSAQICSPCEKALVNALKFKRKCLATEEKILAIEDYMDQNMQEITELKCENEYIFIKDEESSNDESTKDTKTEIDALSLNPMTKSDEYLQGSSNVTTDNTRSFKKAIKKSSSIKSTTTEIWKCRVCKKSYKNIATYQSHRRRNKSTCGQVLIDDAEVINEHFDENSLLTHTNYICNYCYKQFQTHGSYKIHKLKYCERRPNNQFQVDIESIMRKCENCNTFYSNQNNYDAHILSGSCRKQLIDSKKIPDLFKCENCDKTFISRTLYNNHISKNICSKKLCPHCGKMISHKNYAPHITTHFRQMNNLKPYKCDQCDKTFSLSGNLSHHKRRHVGEKRYECDYCHEKFMTWHVRRCHIHKYHLKKGVFDCRFCGQPFFHAHTYNLHVKKEHLLELKYACDICDKKFVAAWVLAKHKKHHEKGQFECDICKKTYSTKRYLRIHMIVHTGERNYQCPVCLKEFTQNHVMRTHIVKLHPDYDIPPLGTVMSKKGLKRIHDRNKRYQL